MERVAWMMLAIVLLAGLVAADETMQEATVARAQDAGTFCAALSGVPTEKEGFMVIVDLTMAAKKNANTDSLLAELQFVDSGFTSALQMRECTRDELCTKNEIKGTAVVVRNGEPAQGFSKLDMQLLKQGYIGGAVLLPGFELVKARVYVQGEDMETVEPAQPCQQPKVVKHHKEELDSAGAMPSSYDETVNNENVDPETEHEKKQEKEHKKHEKEHQNKTRKELEKEKEKAERKAKVEAHKAKKEAEKAKAKAKHEAHRLRKQMHRVESNSSSARPWWVWAMIAGIVVMSVLLACACCVLCRQKRRCKKACKGGKCSDKKMVQAEEGELADPVVYVAPVSGQSADYAAMVKDVQAV